MRTIALVAALAVLSACAGSNGGGGGTPAGIAEVSSARQAAFNRGDPQAMAQLYSEDAVIMAPGAPWLEGRESVVEVWQRVLDQDVRDLDLRTQEIDAHRNTATELGRFTMTAPDGQGGRQTVDGKYMVHWKRNLDGAWRLHWDIWNNSPPQG